MSKDLENFLRKGVEEKSSDHYITVVQKVKMFIDGKLTESAGKTEEERLQMYFSTLMNLRDLMISELSDVAFRKNLHKSIDTFLKLEKVKEDDLATFKKLQQEDPKKNEQGRE